ncbi:hypothetical protein ACPUYX_16585 [Desulfosporosinus sp. SYSU MS00001]|uniref:hypothetical protein n=1 Tax=Desulfosporosinus sp. SYSU MS00001 TaxID=3416284 RepID=UPI003CF0E603
MLRGSYFEEKRERKTKTKTKTKTTTIANAQKIDIYRMTTLKKAQNKTVMNLED